MKKVYQVKAERTWLQLKNDTNIIKNFLKINCSTSASKTYKQCRVKQQRVVKLDSEVKLSLLKYQISDTPKHCE